MAVYGGMSIYPDPHEWIFTKVTLFGYYNRAAVTLLEHASLRTSANVPLGKCPEVEFLRASDLQIEVVLLCKHRYKSLIPHSHTPTV